MLHYGIGALLIVLVITLTLSYYYNMEGFDAVTNSAVSPAVSPVEQSLAPIDTTIVAAAPKKGDIIKTTGNSGTLSNKPPSQSIKVNNIDSLLKKDKLSVKAEYKGKFLRIFATMPSLTDNEAQQLWLISGQDAGIAPPIWKLLIVTNDPAYESAAIPEPNYAPYVGQTAYIVPRGSSNPDDAYTSFIIPIPPTKPNVVNPRVTLSDTGYSAMKLNKHSNLLNDVQKIIHNEMLANRSLDVVVKNPRSGAAGSAGSARASGAAGSAGSARASGAKGIDAIASKIGPDAIKSALNSMEEEKKRGKAGNSSDDGSDDGSDTCGGGCDGSCGGTCNNSCGGTCEGFKSCQRSDNDVDMSKYIRKDQIPCWNCSLDY